jgi:Acetyltransferase (GNAT) family
MRQRIAIFCLGVVLALPLANTTFAQNGTDWTEPFPPFRIAGNLYYVGSKGLANYLVTTPQGNILINSDLEANVPMIEASIEKLGFKFKDTKILTGLTAVCCRMKEDGVVVSHELAPRGIGARGMSVRFRLMTIEDTPEAMQLKDSASWNQTAADWARFLSANPEGCFVAEHEGRVVGTSTSIIYEGRFAWIGMVIVDSQYRGQGIGTALLERAIRFLDS